MVWLCGICQDNESVPLMITICGHSFCRECLKRISEGVCPVCRKEFEFNGDVQVNYDLIPFTGKEYKKIVVIRRRGRQTEASIYKLFSEVFRDLTVKSISYTIPGESEPKEFRPWTTRWYGRKGSDLPHDPDYPCDGDMRHSSEHQLLLDNALFNGESDGDIDLDIKGPVIYLVEDWSEIKLNFDDSGCETKCSEMIVLEKPIVLINCRREINEDHRGSNHMALDIGEAFTNTISIPKGRYSFGDLAHLAWNIKGNMFDNWYELFCFDEDPTRADIAEIVEEKRDKFILRIPVDHGS